MFTQQLLARVSSAGCSVTERVLHAHACDTWERRARGSGCSVRKQRELKLRAWLSSEASRRRRVPPPGGNGLNQSRNGSESAEVPSGRFRSSSISTWIRLISLTYGFSSQFRDDASGPNVTTSGGGAGRGRGQKRVERLHRGGKRH